LDRLRTTHGVSIRWRSFELRPKGSPPMPPAYRARIEAAQPQLHAMARQHYGLELNTGPFGIDSRPALIGAKYAEEAGAGEAYHRRVFAAYWQQAADISNTDLLADLAVEVGLDRTAFLAALADPGYEAAVDADIAQAQAYGLGGVPATVIAGRYLVEGAQPYPNLAQAIEQIAHEKGAGQ
jgi:predicted DsbA family dithiol-disulfide isomerase